MRSSFYPKLAAGNIRKNAKIYIPFMLTGIITIAMFYIIKSIAYNKGLNEMPGTFQVKSLIAMGIAIVAIFAFIFLFYTNSFLMKNRKKELGLYNVLGLGKTHLMKMIFFEMLIIAVTELAAGIIFGIIFSKLIFLLLIKLLRIPTPLAFMLEPKSIVETLSLFGFIFLAMAFYNMWQVGHVNTVELLHGQHRGEREPKTKIIMTIIGVITLGAGYTIAIVVEHPLQALAFFFIAVVLVVIGTYCLFTAGSIAVLKLLRKNKSYYYKTNHFISVSGMIYRMKQNAVGLANICILSTMVLVMISTTVSLYAGMENILQTRFPYEFEAVMNSASKEELESFLKTAHEEVEKGNISIKDEAAFRSLELFVVAEKKNQLSIIDEDNDGGTSYSSGMIVSVLSLDDYNRMMGASKKLEQNEVLVYMPERNKSCEVEKGTLKLGDFQFEIKEILKALPSTGQQQRNALDTMYMIVPDDKQLIQLGNAIQGEEGGIGIEGDVSLNFKGSKEDIAKVTSALCEKFKQSGINGYTEVREANRDEFYSVYGGFLFLGIFFGSLFLMATVLIIYYKQISEGYDDKERFQIMQKVGMSKKEVRKAIHSQVVSVFALPLIVSIIHICVAFKVIVRLLALLNLSDVGLFRNCMIITAGVFAVIYALVYLLTAREYYRIVN